MHTCMCTNAVAYIVRYCIIHDTGLHGQVQQLEAELERVKNESDLKIRSLRQQHEKVLLLTNTINTANTASTDSYKY
jgi:hypothetical protein